MIETRVFIAPLYALLTNLINLRPLPLKCHHQARETQAGSHVTYVCPFAIPSTCHSPSMSISQSSTDPSIVGTLREHSRSIANDLGKLIEESTPDSDGRIHLNPILTALDQKLGMHCRLNHFKERRTELLEKVASYHGKTVSEIYKSGGGVGGGTWYVSVCIFTSF